MDTRVEQIARKLQRTHTDPLVSASLPVLVQDLEQHGVANVAGWLGELGGRVSDLEQYLDVVAQGWFARVFAHNGLAVTMNPLGTAGPDLLVSRLPHTLYVEVRRFRGDEDEDRRLFEAAQQGRMVQYGNPVRDVRKVLDGVASKARQGDPIPADASYLIALRSDKQSIEEIEFESATREFEQEARCGGGTHAAIGGALFRDCNRTWRLWCNPSARPGRQLPHHIAEILRRLNEPPVRPRPAGLSR